MQKFATVGGSCIIGLGVAVVSLCLLSAEGQQTAAVGVPNSVSVPIAVISTYILDFKAQM